MLLLITGSFIQGLRVDEFNVFWHIKIASDLKKYSAVEY